MIVLNSQVIFATAEPCTTAFSVESVTKQESSSTVTVNISVKNNPGIAGATLSVNYSECLTLIDATNGEAFSNLILTKPGTFRNNCKFLWDSVDGETTANGVILTLTFEVASDAAGDLDVSISCNDGDVYNENLDTVEVQTVNGVVKTSSQSGDIPESDEPTFEVVSATKSSVSSTVSVDIVVKNNPGIAGATLNVKYADGLKLLSVINGTAFSELSLTTPGQYNSPCKFLWDSISGQTLSNGTILTLTFEVESNSKGPFNIEISCNDGDVYNENLDTVCIKTKNGVILSTDGNILFSKHDSTTKVDYSKRFITGLQSHLDSLDNYLSVNNGYECKYNKTIGTGCIVSVKKDDIVVETYTIVIFGDANGDSWYDGQDAMLVNCIVNGMLTREQVGEAVWAAADCNHDGVIDENDVALLNEAGLLLSQVDQTKSEEELNSDSVYQEYLSLIDQNPTEKETEEPTVEPEKPAKETKTFQ